MADTPKALLDDQDLELLKTAEAALDALYEQYYAATPGDQLLLKPQIEQAARGVLNARLKLLEPGTLSAPGDVAEAKRIKDEIDKAASTQQLIIGAAKFISLLAKF